MTLKDLRKLINDIDLPDDSEVWFNIVTEIEGEMCYNGCLEYHSNEPADVDNDTVNINFTEW